MKIVKRKNSIELFNTQDFNLWHVFECGQCFRWKCDEHGRYVGVVRSKPARLTQLGHGVRIECSEEDFETVWRDYFDLDRDYERVRDQFSKDTRISDALEYGKGIRILRQETWEALCSFLISQCNNIPRIRSILDIFCRLFGDPIAFNGETLYSFPAPSRIARLQLEDLDPLRAGYRAKYILNAAKAVESGSFSIRKVSKMPTDLARKELLGLNGVGDKVANCVLLFGMNKLDAFPIDVWMKRAAAQMFQDEKFDGSCFGEYAGIAQQYIFHYIRNSGINQRTFKEKF